MAEQSEIDVLLNALLSPCFSVRDAALRVSLLRDRQQHIVRVVDADQRVTLMSRPFDGKSSPYLSECC